MDFQVTDLCRMCGAQLSEIERGVVNVCSRCAAGSGATGAGQASSNSGFDYRPAAPVYGGPVQYGYQQYRYSQGPVVHDADHPAWGVGTGLLVWGASVAALLVLQLAVAAIWTIVQMGTTGRVPEVTAAEPPESLVFWAVVSSIPAHLVTLAICWGVVTKGGRRPFFASLGWTWAGLPVLARVGLVVGVVVVTFAAAQGLDKILPDKNVTDFEKLLKTSERVRIIVAALAVLTAPLVEEVVYRGVLFAGLRSRLAAAPTIFIVTLMFAGVHFIQYWGAWGAIIQLTFLSLLLTLIRARSKSVLPCFAIHTLFNMLGSVGILFHR
ncbi:MAG TPA: CPBP family intramembrane glutamic endopeptidase [Blastocatellia bacterium]|nr:CPBP family intramembrane glutamic endopeptidase [Blastocatellia bacterium]